MAAGNVEPPARIRREKLNLRFLAWLVGVCAVVVAAYYGLHRFQVRNHAASLLAQADVAEENHRLDRAARFVGLYLGLVPGDTEARARYGMLLDRLANSPRAREGAYVEWEMLGPPVNSPRASAGAMAVFEQVLIREPDRHDIRRRLAVLNNWAGRYDVALQHALA